jgi:hypothetical protein
MNWAASRIDAVGSTVFVLVIVATIIAVGFTHGVLAMALVGSFFLAALGVVALTERLGN